MKTLEVGSRWHAVTGHAKLPSEDVRRALYALLSGFYASPKLHEIAEKRCFSALKGLLDDEEEVALQEKMITIAIRLRILDDCMQGKNELSYQIEAKKWIVGALDDRKGKKEPLTLREGCNKIIHADLFNWRRYGTSLRDMQGLAPQVIVHGSRGKLKWRCYIDVDRFVECACFQLAYTG